MIRKRRKKRKFFSDQEIGQSEINPMDGVANLADVMLVLACGLMLSLIVAWNVDVSDSKLVGIDEDTNLTEVEDKQSQEVEENLSDYQYEEYGVVYRDPKTGKLYIFSEEGGIP